jgi:hypothetical protein
MSEISDEAWEEYLMSGKPEALARFLDLGGEFGDDVREIVVALLRNERPVKYENRSDHWRDYSVYSDVRTLMLQRKCGVMDACKQYVLGKGALTRESMFFEEEVRKVYQQFQRGKLAGQKGGPVYDLDNSEVE